MSDVHGDEATAVRQMVVDKKSIRGLAAATLVIAIGSFPWFVVLYCLMYPLFILSIWSFILANGIEAAVLGGLASLGTFFIIVSGLVLVATKLRSTGRALAGKGLIGSRVIVQIDDDEFLYDGLGRKSRVHNSEISKIHNLFGWSILEFNSGKRELAVPGELLPANWRVMSGGSTEHRKT
ncbi:hypothetical protein ACO2Q7_17105 [Rathayibacter sp. KR2-224]|uniref:hypothetical protein n=1 Tax=Rathayibacter sp. KR2-224 TaxID=3400913 RepID=UPI003C127CF1